jgi:tight adherence protein C
MTIAILAFLCVFLLVASAGMLLFYRQSMLKSISTVVAQNQRATFSETLRSTGTSLGSMVKQFERVVPKSQAETSVVQQRLIRAGYRKDSTISFFYGAKVVVPLSLCIVVFFSGISKGNPLFMYVAAAGLGYLAPDFWLGRRIKARQTAIRLGLPDVLDMLVICVEAGLGLDQATAKTAQELAAAHPAICDELNIVGLEQSAGRARSEAWKHLAERTDVSNVRSLVSTLIQAEQYGTSVSKTLRTHSDTLRTQRIQQVEEMAAKTTVELIFPLVLFIFPCLFLVTLGPAAIVMADAFKNFFHR